MWARWVLAILVAVAVIASIVIAVNRAGPEGATSEAGAEAEANRLADIAITEDEAPHSASLPPGSEPTAALERAIARDVRQRIAGGQLTGPLQGVTRSAAGTGSSGRDPYSCTVHSAEDLLRHGRRDRVPELGERAHMRTDVIGAGADRVADALRRLLGRERWEPVVEFSRRLIAVRTSGTWIVVNCTPSSAHSAAATRVKASSAAFEEM